MFDPSGPPYFTHSCNDNDKDRNDENLQRLRFLTDVMKIGKRGRIESKTEASGRSRSRARKGKRERQSEENEKNDSQHQNKANAVTKLKTGRNEQ